MKAALTLHLSNETTFGEPLLWRIDSCDRNGRAKIVMQWIKPATHIGVPIWISVALLLIQLLTNVPWRATEDNPSSLASAIHMENLDGVPGLWLHSRVTLAILATRFTKHWVNQWVGDLFISFHTTSLHVSLCYFTFQHTHTNSLSLLPSPPSPPLPPSMFFSRRASSCCCHCVMLQLLLICPDPFPWSLWFIGLVTVLIFPSLTKPVVYCPR